MAYCFSTNWPEEYQRGAREALRRPTETGKAVIARANNHVSYPARFQLVAAMNPCRCGWLDDPGQACSRAPRCAADYQSRISGPLLDRIDIHIDVPAVDLADLALPPPAEGSTEIAARVGAARALQATRYEGAGLRTNAEAEGKFWRPRPLRTPRARHCCFRPRKGSS